MNEGSEVNKTALKNIRTEKILNHKDVELEIHQSFHQSKIELEKLRHKHIMEELEFMKKNKITSFDR